MKTGALLIILFCFSNALYADVLEGSFTETGSDNTYTVNIQNDNGHVFTGTASVITNGTLLVNVDDGEGETYTGYAEGNDIDGYALFLKNPKTGLMATGDVDVNEF